MLPAPEPALERIGLCLVPADDPILPVLAEEQARIEAGYRQILPRFRPWQIVDAPASAQLLPGHRFASLGWSEEVRPGEDPAKLLGLAGWLRITAVVDVRASPPQLVATLPDTGNYTEFPELLCISGVHIRDQGDAATVWQAFNELHMKQWPGTPARIAADAWRLHEATVRGNRYFYEVRVGDAGLVLSGRLRHEKIRPRAR